MEKRGETDNFGRKLWINSNICEYFHNIVNVLSTVLM